jgi:tRNA A-37 threonylcarbamoyl transferase component Bud32
MPRPRPESRNPAEAPGSGRPSLDLLNLFADPTARQPSAGAKLVKPVQHRGAGASCVYLDHREHWDGGSGNVYVKRQNNYTCRPLWRGFLRTPTLAREHRALLAMQQIGVPAPEVVSYRQEGLAAELVIADIAGGVPLDEALTLPDSDRNRILTHVAGLIRRLHAAGWTHGALNCEHIFVVPGEGFSAALIDFEKARHGRRQIDADLARIWRRNSALTAADRSLFEATYHDRGA